MTDSTRRQFLRATAASAAAVVTLSATASAAEPPERPDHITAVSDDPAELKQYQPALHTDYSTRQEMQEIRGWKAESSEYETDAYYYWIKYPTQGSVWDRIGLSSSWFGAADAHFRDHEPVVVHTDPSTGEVKRVLYSDWHHYAGEQTADTANLTKSEHPDHATHINLDVNQTHHHYTHEDEGDGALPSEWLGMESFLDVRDAWYDNGVFDASDDTAVEDPWNIGETWWAEDTNDRRFASLYQLLGWYGADDAEDLRGDP